MLKGKSFSDIMMWKKITRSIEITAKKLFHISPCFEHSIWQKKPSFLPRVLFTRKVVLMKVCLIRDMNWSKTPVQYCQGNSINANYLWLFFCFRSNYHSDNGQMAKQHLKRGGKHLIIRLSAIRSLKKASNFAVNGLILFQIIEIAGGAG